jgi:hypothetical protein
MPLMRVPTSGRKRGIITHKNEIRRRARIRKR